MSHTPLYSSCSWERSDCQEQSSKASPGCWAGTVIIIKPCWWGTCSRKEVAPLQTWPCTHVVIHAWLGDLPVSGMKASIFPWHRDYPWPPQPLKLVPFPGAPVMVTDEAYTLLTFHTGEGQGRGALLRPTRTIRHLLCYFAAYYLSDPKSQRN